MSEARFDSLRGILPDVSRETFQHLLQFEALFRRWNDKINLASPTSLSELWTRHILDSAQIARLRPLEGKWLDLGSGGGFPGAILAVLMRDTGNADIQLVESVGKKAAFLRAALLAAGGAGTVHAVRIDAAASNIKGINVVTARALAPLSELLGLAFPWLSAGAVGLFHKGRDFRSELALARDVWAFDLLEHASVIDPKSVILEISNLSQRL